MGSILGGYLLIQGGYMCGWITWVNKGGWMWLGQEGRLVGMLSGWEGHIGSFVLFGMVQFGPDC